MINDQAINTRRILPQSFLRHDLTIPQLLCFVSLLVVFRYYITTIYLTHKEQSSTRTKDIRPDIGTEMDRFGHRVQSEGVTSYRLSIPYDIILHHIMAHHGTSYYIQFLSICVRLYHIVDSTCVYIHIMDWTRVNV